MSTTKLLRKKIDSLISQSQFQILSESPVLTPFLKGLEAHPQVHTLPCSDDMLCNTGIGMAISGSNVIICLSDVQHLTSIFACLEEEHYGPEFPLTLTFLVPSIAVPEIKTQHHYVYCRTGSQLLGQFEAAIHEQNPSIICYSPKALFDLASDPLSATAELHQEGTHISLFTSGPHVEAAKNFAARHHDIELIELISLHPLCEESIAKSVQKTGRVLLLDVPRETMNTIIEHCFWHLEAQPEHTHNSTQSNLSHLRARLLET